MIQISQEELWAFNILDAQIANVESELRKDIAARDSYIKLLELKYDATLDPKSGSLIKNKKGK